MLVKGDVRVADQMILAVQVGQDKIMACTKAQILALGIILHAGTLPLQMRPQLAVGGIVHHMELQLDVALLEALHCMQHPHA